MRAEKVVAFLLNDEQRVVSIVGNKVYGGSAKQNIPAPLVIYAHDTSEDQDHLNELDGLGYEVDANIDVIVVAATYPQLKELGEAVRVAVHNKSGVIAGVTVIETRKTFQGPDTPHPELDEFSQVWSFLIRHVVET